MEEKVGRKEIYEFIGNSIYIPEKKILVMTDLHIGYEETLKDKGVFLPKTQYKKIEEKIENILERVDIKTIIILGDLKHEFGKISDQEWRETKKIINFLESKVKKIILLRGNHDTILGPIAGDKNLEVKDYYIKDGMAFLHGDKKRIEVLDKKIKKIFLGHMHPAITINKGVKKETYKCFLVGKYKDKEIVILPSFFPLVEGSNILVSNTNLDFKFDLKKFNVYIPVEGENKILDFGKVKDMGELV